MKADLYHKKPRVNLRRYPKLSDDRTVPFGWSPSTRMGTWHAERVGRGLYHAYFDGVNKGLLKRDPGAWTLVLPSGRVFRNRRLRRVMRDVIGKRLHR